MCALVSVLACLLRIFLSFSLSLAMCSWLLVSKIFIIYTVFVDTRIRFFSSFLFLVLFVCLFVFFFLPSVYLYNW